MAMRKMVSRAKACGSEGSLADCSSNWSLRRPQTICAKRFCNCSMGAPDISRCNHLTAVVRPLTHSHNGMKAATQQRGSWALEAHAIQRQCDFRLHLWNELFSIDVLKKGIWIKGSSHELNIDVATSPDLSRICRRRAKWCGALHDCPAELVVLVRRCEVRTWHKSFTSSSDPTSFGCGRSAFLCRLFSTAACAA